jgi:hypothetical protein
MPGGTEIRRESATFGTTGAPVEDCDVTAGPPNDTMDHAPMGQTSLKETRNMGDAVALKNSGLNDHDADDRGYSDA